MIHREHYISKIRPFFDSDLIKIITGIRRCGKSVIKDQIENEIKASGKPTISLDFERHSVSSVIYDADTLIEYIEEHRSHDPEEKTYIFLDEIQNVEDWNIACRSLRLDNLSIFITGSNSKLLAKEFTKELSGRYVSFCIKPFVYKEICMYADMLGKKKSITDYLIYGGFPKTLEFDDNDSVIQYLNDLDQQIVMNDIMLRYKVKKQELFRRLVNYVLISNSRIFSANSILKYLRGQGLDCSINTIMKYIGYLEEAFVIRSVSQYSTKAKRELSFFKKLYDEDVAFNTIRQPHGKYDLTHNLENIIYNELIYMGYDLSVYKTDKGEIDFLAEKKGKEYLIQVAYSIVDDSIYEREFRSFNELDMSRKKMIITNDDVDFSSSTVSHIRLKDFLMMKDLEDII